MDVTALHLFAQLTEAIDERTKAKIIAEAIGQLEERYPNRPKPAPATRIRLT